MKRLATDAWSLDLPDGVIGRVVDPGPGYTSLAIARGWLPGDAPTTITVSTRPREGTTLRRFAGELGGWLTEPAGDGEAVEVAGAHGARRLDGLMEREEGVAADGVERVTLLLAARRHELVLLMVRTDATHDTGEAVERLVASLTLAP